MYFRSLADSRLVKAGQRGIAWVCFNIGWNLFDLVVLKKVMESREQAVVPTASVGLLATNNMRKRRFKMLHAVGEVQERDKLPHSPVDRVDTCSEGSLAPESRATTPHPASSSHSPPSPLPPPTLRLGDSSGQSPPLAAPSPPSKISSDLNPTKGESTAVDAELMPPRQSVLTKTQSTSRIPREPDVNRTGIGPDLNATHGPSLQPSPNHPSPPSLLAQWTPFTATSPLQAGYVKKRSRKSDFWGGSSKVFGTEIRFSAPEPEPEFKKDAALKILNPFGLKGKGEAQVSTRLTEE
ncbi:hypothetical protein FRC04_001141 [Tulasnella sp. 424]|nr:hypothetical protein FRC04_001141 [Tulasnella sp. 424]